MSTYQMSKYTAPQYTAARKLAAEFGHGWVSAVPAEHPIPGARWTPGFIRELYLAKRDRDHDPTMLGITDPGDVTQSGLLRHTSHTGRIQWQIASDGTVGFAITRPGNEHAGFVWRRTAVVLSACVSPAGDVAVRTPDTRGDMIPDVWDLMWSPEGGPRAEARHGDALWRALAALVGETCASNALATSGVVHYPTWPAAL